MEETNVRKRKRSRKFRILYAVIFGVLILYTISIFLPVLWGILTSLKNQDDFGNNVLGLPQGMPWEWHWENFYIVFDGFYEQVTTPGVGRRRVYFSEMLLYTVLYAGGGAVIQTIVPCYVAYLTARFRYKFSDFINGLVIVLMVIPIVGSAPSEMQILRTLGLYDTIWGNYIQKFNFLGMYYLVFYAAMRSIPNDFFEAAYVDGASEFRVMVSIGMPMVRNIIGTVLLIKFIDFWNDYQTPLLYLPSYPTLARGVFRLSQNTQGDFATVPFRMAGCMFLAIPILILFLIFKEKLMGNLSMGGIKE